MIMDEVTTSTMTKILAINGSYRKNGVTDKALSLMIASLEASGAEVETIQLRDYPINFCNNCRSCTQTDGEQPGECVQQDSMAELIKKIEQVDGYLLASPTNMGATTALYKRFNERLISYAYWPWGATAPKMRKALTKKAVLISSSAAPGFMAKLFFETQKQLNSSAKVLGAKTVGRVSLGLVAKSKKAGIPRKARRELLIAANKLLG